MSEIFIKDDHPYFSITIPANRAEELEQLRLAAEKVVADISGVSGVTAVLTAEASGAPTRTASGPVKAISGPRPEHPRVRGGSCQRRNRRCCWPASGRSGGAQPAAKAQGIPGVKHVIAVASGKGGVGKSTVAVNLALGLQAIGMKVGIIDADIYGPSQPRLFGVTGKPQVTNGKVIKPLEGWGLKVMSMGFLVDEGTPVDLARADGRSALAQMLRETDWAGRPAISMSLSSTCRPAPATCS